MVRGCPLPHGLKVSVPEVEVMLKAPQVDIICEIRRENGRWSLSLCIRDERGVLISGAKGASALPKG